MLQDSLITAPAAARLLGVTVQRLYELSREGVVPSVRLGRSFRYSPSALNEFIQKGGGAWAGGWRKCADDQFSARGHDSGDASS